jgi:hypothetical protein
MSKHRTVFRQLVQAAPTLIFEHFHFLLEHRQLQEDFFDIIRKQPFEQRRKWFYENLPRPAANPNRDTPVLQVTDRKKEETEEEERNFRNAA